MHALSVLKNACLTALDHDEDDPGAKADFYSIVGPSSVLELINLVEAAWTDEEKKALGKLLDELVGFVKRSPAHDKERAELIMRARQLRGLMGI